MTSQSLVQSVDWWAIAPPVILAVTALAALLGDLLTATKSWLAWLSLAGVVTAATALATGPGRGASSFCLLEADQLPSCAYRVTTATLVLQGLLLVAGAVLVLLSARTVAARDLPAGEYWFLLLSSLSGAVLLPATTELTTLVIALEVLTLPLFALVGLERYGGRGGEAALKFFLVSVVSTAVMLFGVSLLYGATGSLELAAIARGVAAGTAPASAVAVGTALLLAGFGFKIAAVPFHFWAPDTYAGAPVPVAAYLSVVSKAAGFGALLTVLPHLAGQAATWAPVLAVLATVTMTVGNLVALRQSSALRLLAWSSVAQSGYLLAPLGAVARHDAPAQANAAAATLVYLAAYAALNLLVFAVVSLVSEERSGAGRLLADYRGLARTRPGPALALAFGLIGLAGLPPALIGLLAKVVIFRAVLEAGTPWLLVPLAANTVIALYYYLRWTALLFLPAEQQQPVAAPASTPVTTGLGLALATATAVALTVAPQTLLRLL